MSTVGRRLFRCVPRDSGEKIKAGTGLLSPGMENRAKADLSLGGLFESTAGCPQSVTRPYRERYERCEEYSSGANDAAVKVPRPDDRHRVEPEDVDQLAGKPAPEFHAPEADRAYCQKQERPCQVTEHEPESRRKGAFVQLGRRMAGSEKAGEYE